VTRHIRYAAFFCVLLLAALLVNAARVQVVQSPAYDDNPANRRATIARYGQPRGNILVGGRPVTGSRDSGEQLRFERTYVDGPLYAPVTGFASQEYGRILLEATEDGVLAGTDPLLAPLPLLSDLTRARAAGGDVETTLDREAQRAAYGAGGAQGRGGGGGPGHGPGPGAGVEPVVRPG
jgi:hypothetical protein